MLEVAHAQIGALQAEYVRVLHENQLLRAHLHASQVASCLAASGPSTMPAFGGSFSPGAQHFFPPTAGDEALMQRRSETLARSMAAAREGMAARVDRDPLHVPGAPPAGQPPTPPGETPQPRAHAHQD
jgi:hypothetical protein